MELITGLGLFGYGLSKSATNTELKDNKIPKNTKYTINDYKTHYLNNYTVDLLKNNNSKINEKLNIDYKQSISPNSHIVNDNWRYETYNVENNKINNLLSKDIGMIKNKKYLTNNKIEPMQNMSDDQSDSVFSDDYQTFNLKSENNSIILNLSFLFITLTISSIFFSILEVNDFLLNFLQTTYFSEFEILLVNGLQI